jgi:DNA-binding transcriptional LysR family regulator
VPELRQLRAFVAVAEELNFTRAAERLHLAQQAVSKSVRQLERELGVPLLERTTREVRLTAAGTALLQSGREVLVSADAAFERARTVGRGLAGTVRIGITPAVGTDVRDEVSRALRDDAPDLLVSFHEVRPGEVPGKLRDHAVDLVLARTDRGASGVDSASLRPSPVELFVPRGHRLADAPGVRLAQLDGERLLTWSAPGTPYTDMLLDRLAAAGARVEPVQALVLGGGQQPPDLTGTGAVALMPAGWPTGEHNVRLPIDDEMSLPLLVLWPAGRPPPAVERVRRALATTEPRRSDAAT